MKEYTIYTARIAYELRKRGFLIIRTDINPHKPQFDCWVFEDTPKLHKALTEITKK